MAERKTFKVLRCPSCNSKQLRSRAQKPRYICRRCGWRGGKPIEEREPIMFDA